MSNRPTAKKFKSFVHESKDMNPKVISSMLFHHMVDSEAHFKTRLVKYFFDLKRAAFAAEALIKEVKGYFMFFNQNENNLDVIDADEMKEENEKAGKELEKTLKSIKKALGKGFGEKEISLLDPNTDWMDDIKVTK